MQELFRTQTFLFSFSQKYTRREALSFVLFFRTEDERLTSILINKIYQEKTIIKTRINTRVFIVS